MSDVGQSQVPSTGLDQFEVQELVEFVMGVNNEPPKSLDRMMTNLYQKLQMGLGYSVASNVQRQVKLIKFIGKVEDEIFNISDEELHNMSKEQLDELYKSASKVLGEMNEFERRFLAQNKDMFNSSRTEQEKLAQELMSLSPDKLEAIMKIIKGEKIAQEDSAMEDELGDL